MYRRDGLLAVGTLAGLLAVGALTTGWGVFGHPRAILAGIAVALVVEALFLRYPDALLPIWESPVTAVGSVVLLGCLAAGAVWYRPWFLGALAWGIVTYLCLLGYALT